MSLSNDAGKLFSSAGLVAVVTGGGTGIGLMMAAALENNGAKVYIVGRRKEVLENAARVHAKYGKILPIVADINSKQSLTSLVDHITQEDGYINLLINNSGILGPQHHQIPRPPPFESLNMPEAASFKALEDVQAFLWKDETSDWAGVLQTNITGGWFTAVAFLRLLDEGNKRQKVTQSSQIITISSISGFSRAVQPSFLYGASKAACTHLAKMMATSFVQWGIRSNVIAPGIYPSEMSVGPDQMDSENRSLLPPDCTPAMIPLQRAGSEEDMAGVILYMTGKSGAYLNGSVIVTDGGRLSIAPATF